MPASRAYLHLNGHCSTDIRRWFSNRLGERGITKQKMPESANQMARVGTHATLFATFAYTTVYNILYAKENLDEGFWEYKGYGGKMKFLTFWCLLLQTAYFGLALFNDLLGTNLDSSFARSSCSRLQRFRDSFLASIVWPIGTFVVLTFWGIYAIDRELVFPRRLDAIIPLWLNHMEHTAVLPFMLLEKYLVCHHYPSRVTGISRTLLFGFVYNVWIFWVALYADIWVYPIFAVLTWVQRGLFVFILWLTLVIIYLAGEYLTDHWWPKSRKGVKSD